MTDEQRLAKIRNRNLAARKLAQRHGDEYPTQDAAEIGFLLDLLDAANYRADSIQLALDAERYTHLRNNEELLQQRDAARAENERMKAMKVFRDRAAANATLDRVRELPEQWEAVVSSTSYESYDAGYESALMTAALELRDALGDEEEGK